MPTVWKEVEFDVDLDDFEDEELIDEIERRKYFVSEKEIDLLKFQDVIDWYKRGNVKEALIQLERIIPELYGISGKIKE
jgi:hypothetical protein